MPEPAVDLDRVGETDLTDPADVATTESEAHVIVVEEDEPPFEPELPWDKHQEPDITANKRIARLVQPIGRRAAISTGADADAATDAAAFTGELTTGGLQHSHSIFGEVTQSSDPMVFRQTHKYRFSLFYHPYVCDFMVELRRSGVSGLLDPNPDGPAKRLVRQQKSLDFFVDRYLPTANVLNTPIQDIDFEIGGAYAKYNWEIFFHAPLLIASRLSRNQRFEEARRWFHFIFDPTNVSDDEDPLRFWKIKPFYRDPDEPIADFLALAASTEDSPEVEMAARAVRPADRCLGGRPLRSTRHCGGSHHGLPEGAGDEVPR